MALYRYKAVTVSGEVLEGQFDVASNDEAIAKIQDAGNIPLEISAADAGDAGGMFGGLGKRQAMNQGHVLQVTQQLETLLGAGEPLDRALQILLELPESEKARRIIERVRDHVRGGGALSDALEAEPAVFSRLYVNMVRAGEVGGSLDTTLDASSAMLFEGVARGKDEGVELAEAMSDCVSVTPDLWGAFSS